MVKERSQHPSTLDIEHSTLLSLRLCLRNRLSDRERANSCLARTPKQAYPCDMSMQAACSQARMQPLESKSGFSDRA